MMKFKIPFSLTLLSLTFVSNLVGIVNPTFANTFDETAVDQNNFVAIAQPYGENKYNLIVLEQIPDKKSCWSETGSNPVNIDLLLLNFDFSGHCRRSTDANGYSIRYNGEDLGLNYLLSVVERNGELQLIGVNRLDRSKPEILVATSQGLNTSAMKMILSPGWRFSKRTFQGKLLSHFYFSYTDAQAIEDGGNTTPNTNPNMDPNVDPNSNMNPTDPTNLDSIPEGGVDVITPPSNPTPETPIPPIPENKNQNKKYSNNYKIIGDRFEQMRNR